MARKKLTSSALKNEGRGPRKRKTIVPASNELDEDSRLGTVRKAFAEIDKIRARAKPLPKGMTVKDLIEDGRR
jgi:hypothetical protein